MAAATVDVALALSGLNAVTGGLGQVDKAMVQQAKLAAQLQVAQDRAATSAARAAAAQASAETAVLRTQRQRLALSQQQAKAAQQAAKATRAAQSARGPGFGTRLLGGARAAGGVTTGALGGIGRGAAGLAGGALAGIGGMAGRVGGALGGLTGPLGSAVGALGQFGGALGTLVAAGARTAIGALTGLGSTLGGLVVSGARLAGGALMEAGGHALALAGTVGGIVVRAGAAGALALGGLGAIVGKTGVDFLAMKEQAQVAFTTLLGDGGKATAFLSQIQALAASTPFEFPDLVVGAQRLLAMGFAAKDVIPTLTAIGDAVAAMGGSKEQIDRVTLAFGQMQAKGRVQGDEMLQLAEAGIPAWKYLAQTLGVDIPTAMKMVSKGQVASAVGIAAITKGMQHDFGGAMAAQSRTWNGLISSAKDYARIMAGTAMGPVFDRVLKPALEAVAAFMAGPGQKAAERFAAALDRGITRALHAWRDFRDGLAGGVKDLSRMGGAVSGFRRLGQEARNFIDTMRGSFSGGFGGTLALGLLLIRDSITTRVIPAIQLLWRTFAPFTGGQAGDGLRTFQRIVLGVAGVVDRLARGFQLGVDAVVTFRQALRGEWFPNSAGNAFVNIVGNIGMALSSLPDIISENLTRLDNLRGIISSMPDIIRENLTRLDDLRGTLSSLPDIIGELSTKNETLHKAFLLARDGADQLKASLDKLPKVTIPAPVVAGAAGAGALAVANPGLALAAGRAGIAALGSVAGVVISIVGGLVAILGGPLTLGIVALVAAGALLYAAWVNNWGNIQGVVLPILDLLAGELMALWGWITNVATQVATYLTPYLLALGGAIQQAIVNATPGVTAFFAGLIAFAQAAWPTIQLVAGVILDTLGPAIQAFFAWGTTVIPLIGQAIGDSFLFVGTMLAWLAGVWQAHHDAMALIFLGFWNVIAGLAQVLWGTFQNIITLGLALLTGDWQLAWDTMLLTVNNFNAGIGTILTGLAGIFGGFGLLIIDVVKTAFGTAWDTWVGIGSGIVDGIKAGITSAWEGLKTLLSGLANDLPGPVKAALGIQSPSTVFANQVGAMIPAGIAMGITGNAGVIDGALSGLALGAGAAAGATGGSATTGGAAGQGGGNVVYLTVNYNSPLTAADVARAHAAELLAAVREGLGEGGAGLVAPAVSFGGGRS